MSAELPYPDKNSPVLAVIFDTARQHLAEGLDPFEVALHAAVTAWMEGHLEGRGEGADREQMVRDFYASKN